MRLASRSHFSRNWKKLTGDKKNFGKCAGLQNLISRGSNPGQGSSQLKNEYRSTCFSESRNRKHVAERCHLESVTCFRRVFKQPVSGRQIRWRKEVSDKPEKSKFVYTIPAFQRGWLPSNKRSLVGGGLHVQERSSRCILYNTDNPKVQEIPQVQMGGKPVRVSLSLLRTRPSTSEIYKINEGPYCSAAAPKHLPKNIPGRHADNGQISTGIDLSSRHCDLPSAESWICTEFKEVSSRTISENRKMEISLPQEKFVKLMPQSKQVAGSKEITIMNLTKLIEKLGLTAQTILPAQLQVRYLQRLEWKAHIIILELKAVHLAILTFTKFRIVQRMHVQMDSKRFGIICSRERSQLLQCTYQVI